MQTQGRRRQSSESHVEVCTAPTERLHRKTHEQRTLNSRHEDGPVAFDAYPEPPRVVNTHQLMAKLLAYARTSPELAKVRTDVGGLNMHASLVLISTRLDSETRRATDAEQRATLLLSRATTAESLLATARSDLTKSQDDLRLYKSRLEVAQAEIHHAQRMVDELEHARAKAEDEAARARSSARKMKEELLSRLAREEGRREGYEEGLRRGQLSALSSGRNFAGPVLIARSLAGDTEVSRPSQRTTGHRRARSQTVTSLSRPIVPSEKMPRREVIRILSPPRKESEPIAPVIRLDPSPPLDPRRGHHRSASVPPQAFVRPPVPDVAPFGSNAHVPTITTPFVPEAEAHIHATAPPGTIPLHAPQPKPASESPNSLPTVASDSLLRAPVPDPRRTSLADGHFSPWEVIPEPVAPAVAWNTPTQLPPGPRLPTVSSDASVKKITPPSQPLSEIDLVTTPAVERPLPLKTKSLQDVLQATFKRAPTPDAGNHSRQRPRDEGRLSMLSRVRTSSSAAFEQPRSIPAPQPYAPQRAPVAQPHNPVQNVAPLKPRRQSIDVEPPMPVPSNPAPKRPVSSQPAATRRASLSGRPVPRVVQRQEVKPAPISVERPPPPAPPPVIVVHPARTSPSPPIEPPAQAWGALGRLLRVTNPNSNRDSKRSSTSTVPEIGVESPSAPPSSASRETPRSQAFLLSPEHAHNPLPPFPDPDHVMDTIVASIRDSGFSQPTHKPAEPMEEKDRSHVYTVAPPRGIGGDQMPSGFAPTREGEDYFSSKPVQISVTAPPTKPAGKVTNPSKTAQHQTKYAEAPLPPGVIYPESPSSRDTSLSSSSLSGGTSLLESKPTVKPRLRVVTNLNAGGRNPHMAAGLPIYTRG